jgi:hypothetical protein
MPVHARRLIRKMRGGAQAHLVECDDGNHYVVKFTNNPQHRRILVNEWMSAWFLDYLRISAPPAEAVEVDAAFLDAHEDACFRMGAQRQQIEPGWHFGSRYPGHPERLAVYDFLPDQLLEKVANLRDMVGVLVFDKWMGNADARQAIFFRARLKEWLPADGEHPLKVGFVAQMIDHGYVFNGPEWTFSDGRAQGFYFRRQVYRGVRRMGDFQPWLDRIISFPEEVADRAWKQMPPAWMKGEEEEFEKLLRNLMRRRERVPELLREAAEARPGPFPDWGRG